jgi:hypothetical protein
MYVRHEARAIGSGSEGAQSALEEGYRCSEAMLGRGSMSGSRMACTQHVEPSSQHEKRIVPMRSMAVCACSSDGGRG